MSLSNEEKLEFLDKHIVLEKVDGEIVITGIAADIHGDHVGNHEGDHVGLRKGNHYGDHEGRHYGDHYGKRVGKHYPDGEE